MAAEDVAAEAMARAYAHWRKIGDQPWREGWVVRVATNLALDAARKRSRVAARPYVDASPSSGPTTEEQQDAIATRAALVEALARLPKRQREVVAMRHLAQMSEADVAAALRVSSGSVKTHLSRGLASLRRSLGAEGNPLADPIGETTGEVVIDGV